MTMMNKAAQIRPLLLAGLTSLASCMKPAMGVTVTEGDLRTAGTLLQNSHPANKAALFSFEAWQISAIRTAERLLTDPKTSALDVVHALGSYYPYYLDWDRGVIEDTHDLTPYGECPDGSKSTWKRPGSTECERSLLPLWPEDLVKKGKLSTATAEKAVKVRQRLFKLGTKLALNETNDMLKGNPPDGIVLLIRIIRSLQLTSRFPDHYDQEGDARIDLKNAENKLMALMPSDKKWQIVPARMTFEVHPLTMKSGSSPK